MGDHLLAWWLGRFPQDSDSAREKCTCEFSAKVFADALPFEENPPHKSRYQNRTFSSLGLRVSWLLSCISPSQPFLLHIFQITQWTTPTG